MHQDEIIGRFIAKYNDCQDEQYAITGWPDKENRNARACDAFAETDEKKALAIEHTNIQTFDQQLLEAARFMKVIGELEGDLKNAFDCETDLIVPTFAIQTGTDWDAIRTTIRDWLLANVPVLPEGRTKHQLNGIPFEVTVDIDRDKRLSPLFCVSRWVPPNTQTYDQLTNSIVAALTDKNDQLRVYHEQGIDTILILESQDIALVSPATLYKAFLKAVKAVACGNIDQIWVARTYQDNCELGCFQAEKVIMDQANPENFEWGPRYAKQWEEAIRQDEAAN